MGCSPFEVATATWQKETRWVPCTGNASIRAYLPTFQSKKYSAFFSLLQILWKAVWTAGAESQTCGPAFVDQSLGLQCKDEREIVRSFSTKSWNWTLPPILPLTPGKRFLPDPCNYAQDGAFVRDGRLSMKLVDILGSLTYAETWRVERPTEAATSGIERSMVGTFTSCTDKQVRCRLIR